MWYGKQCHKGVGSTYWTREILQPGSTINFQSEHGVGVNRSPSGYLTDWRSVCYNSHHLLNIYIYQALFCIFSMY